MATKESKVIKAVEVKEETISITAPKIETIVFKIEGTSPFVQLRFAQKTKYEMTERMATSSKASKGKRDARDYDAEFENAMYLSSDGWRGIPSTAFRCAMISACRTVGFKMTLAKLSVFIIADGFDADDGTPLTKITSGKPKLVQHACRNANGNTDIRTRAMWEKWTASVKVSYDANQFSATDVSNLMLRAGMQVGVGEGRNDSRNSAGMGWGNFKILA